MKFGEKYISSICPELGKWEVRILKDSLLDMNDPRDIYEQQVRVTARSMFPELYNYQRSIAHKHVRDAVALLEQADSILAEIPDISDEVAKTQLDIRSNVVYLRKDIGGK